MGKKRYSCSGKPGCKSGRLAIPGVPDGRRAKAACCPENWWTDVGPEFEILNDGLTSVAGRDVLRPQDGIRPQDVRHATEELVVIVAVVSRVFDCRKSVNGAGRFAICPDRGMVGVHRRGGLSHHNA